MRIFPTALWLLGIVTAIGFAVYVRQDQNTSRAEEDKFRQAEVLATKEREFAKLLQPSSIADLLAERILKVQGGWVVNEYGNWGDKIFVPGELQWNLTCGFGVDLRIEKIADADDQFVRIQLAESLLEEAECTKILPVVGSTAALLLKPDAH